MIELTKISAIIRKVCMMDLKFLCTPVACKGDALQGTVLAFLLPALAVRQTDSKANAMNVGVCQAYVDIPEISKNKCFLHTKKGLSKESVF